MATPQFEKPIALPISPEELGRINEYLSELTPEDVLRWAMDHLPGLFQTTAFGLTGLVAIDMLSKTTQKPPPLIFIDTLYHFPETYELVEEVKRKYCVPINVYKPEGCENVQEFEEQHGKELWKSDETAYDYYVKVEPARRAYAELGVKAVITGRRASQGAARAGLKPLEVDETGLIKLNPLFAWTFQSVEAYVQEKEVPKNKLLSQGYKSIGDWHSTAKSGEGDSGERGGRWAENKEKTECGLHADYFAMKIAMKKREAERLQAQKELISVES